MIALRLAKPRSGQALRKVPKRNCIGLLDRMPDDPIEVIDWLSKMPFKDFDRVHAAMICEQFLDGISTNTLMAMLCGVRERYRIQMGMNHFRLVKPKGSSVRVFVRVRGGKKTKRVRRRAS